MDGKKLQVEISLKDNLSKQLEKMSKGVINQADNIKKSISNIQKSFDSLKINSGLDKQVSTINKQISNLGKNAKDIEVNVKANMDKSGLDFSDILQLGATSQMASATKQMTEATKQIAGSTGEMSESYKKLSVEQEKVFTEGIKGLGRYRNHIGNISDVYESFLDLITNPNIDTKTLESSLKILEARCESSISMFKILRDELKMPEASSTVAVLEKLKNAINGFQLTGDFSGLERLEEKIKEVLELNKKPLNLEVNVNDEKLIKLADDIVTITSQINNGKNILSKYNNSLINIDPQSLAHAEQIAMAMDEVRTRTAKLNLELFKVASEFNRLTGATLPAGSAMNGLKATMAVLVPETSKLGIMFQTLKTKIDTTIGSMSTKFAEFKSKVTEAIDKVKTKISSMIPEKVKTSFNTVKTVISSWVPTLKNVGTKLKEFGKKMETTSKSSDKLKNSMSGLRGVLSKIGTYFGLYQLVNFGKQAINTASDVQEAQNVIDVTFGKSAETINNWSKTTAAAFGLTELQAKNFAGTFGATFSASGVNGDYIDDMSMNLSQLAGDLASFRNLTPEEAFEKLRSAISGSVEPMQALGYNMNVATMDSYLLSQGIHTSFSELSESNKQIVRYNYLMQQTSSLQGDYKRTTDSFANSVRNLKNSFSVFASEIGQTLMVALVPIIRVISTIIGWMTALAKVFNNFLRSIGILKSVENATSGTVSGIQDTSTAVGSIGESAEESADGVGKLKKEMKSLMGIDEINKLGEPEQEEIDIPKGTPVDENGIEVPLIPVTPDYTGEIESQIESMMEKIKNFISSLGLDFSPIKNIDFGPLKESFGKLYESIKPTLDMCKDAIVWFINEVLVPLGAYTIETAIPLFFEGLAKVMEKLNPIIETAGKALGWFIENVLGPLAKWTIEEVMPRFFETLANILNIISPIFDVVVENFKTFFENVLGPIGEFAGDAFLAFWDALNGLLKKFGDWLNENETAAKILGDIATALIGLWAGKKIIGGISSVVTWLGKIGPLFTSIGGWVAKAGGLFTKLWGVLKVIGGAIMTGITAIATALGLPVAAVVAIIAAVAAAVVAIIAYWDEICAGAKWCWEKIKEFASWCWDGIKKLWGGLCDFFSGLWNGVKNGAKTVGKWIGDKFKQSWETTKKGWEKAGNFFGKCWDGIKSGAKTAGKWIGDKFKESWETTKKGWESAGNFFGKCWDGIKSGAKTAGEWISNKFKESCENSKRGWESAKSFFSKTWDGIKGTFSDVGSWFKTQFSNGMTNAKNAWSNAKSTFSTVWSNIKSAFSDVGSWFKTQFTNGMTNAKNAWSNAKSTFSTVWSNVKSGFNDVGGWFKTQFTNGFNNAKNSWGNAKTTFGNIWSNVKSGFGDIGSWFKTQFNNAKNNISSVWTGIKEMLTKPFDGAKSVISTALENIKKLFKFEWSLPKIKLPHFTITPAGWEFGDLLKGKIPKLSISWYKDGGIMTNPTLLGMTGNTAHIGGEAGAEGIIPLNTLWEQIDKFADKIVSGVISNAVTNNNNGNITVHVDLDGKTIATSVINNVNRMTKLNGKSPLR